ncbi:MAG: hypothetical protein FJX62_25285 [Alphaproteobacteria bacterium]|nr:hypothetical protein [Alphaproteobacteria bacterium]
MAANRELKELPSLDTASIEWEATRFPDFHVKVLSFKDKTNMSIGRMSPICAPLGRDLRYRRNHAINPL